MKKAVKGCMSALSAMKALKSCGESIITTAATAPPQQTCDYYSCKFTVLLNLFYMNLLTKYIRWISNSDSEIFYEMNTTRGNHKMFSSGLKKDKRIVYSSSEILTSSSNCQYTTRY